MKHKFGHRAGVSLNPSSPILHQRLTPHRTPKLYPAAMATTMPLTFSPPRLLHRQRQAKPQQPRSPARLALLQSRGAAAARLRCAPDGGGEVSTTTAEQEGQAAAAEEEEFVLLASNRSDFNEVIMVIDSPSNRYLVLDPSRTLSIHPPRTWIVLVPELSSSSVFGCLVQGMSTAFSPRTAPGPIPTGYVYVRHALLLYHL